jgi:hypothetical protein
MQVKIKVEENERGSYDLNSRYQFLINWSTILILTAQEITCGVSMTSRKSVIEFYQLTISILELQQLVTSGPQ